MKSLMLLGVERKRYPGTFRGLNASDFKKKIITLVFKDMKKPDAADELDFYLWGDFALLDLAHVVKRHALVKQNSFPPIKESTSPKESKTKFKESITVNYLRMSDKKPFEKEDHDDTIEEAHHTKADCKEYTNRKTITLSDDYQTSIKNFKNVIEYFADVEEIYLKSREYFYDVRAVREKQFIARVLLLAPNLKRVVVPVGVDPSYYVNYWSSVWHQKLEVCVFTPAPDPVQSSNNDNETKSIHSSRSSPIQLQLQSSEPRTGAQEPRPVGDADDTEEQPWTDVQDPYGNLTKVVVCAVTVTAVAYKASTFQATPSQLFWAVSRLDGVVQQAVRTASRVPFLPSAVRLAGSIANTTIGPVARNVAKLFG